MKTIILKYLRPFFKRMSIGFSIKTVGTLVELTLPYILSHILKNVIVTKSLAEVVGWGLLMVLAAGFSCLMNIVANRMAAGVARDFSKSVRHDLFNSTLRLSAADVDRFTIPSLESRITTDTYNIHHFIGMMQRMGVRAPILLIGGILITLIMDSFLALAMLAVLPFIFVTVYFISKKGVPLYKKVQSSVDKMIRVVREDAKGIRVIKALSKTEYEKERYDKVNKDLAADETKAGITMAAVNPIMTLLMNSGITMVVAIAAGRVSNHTSDPETVIAFMQYFTMISMAMMTVTRIFIMYTKSSASAARIAEVVFKTNEITTLPITEDSFTCTNDTDDLIVFDNVTFSYNKVKPNLKNISFRIKKGGSLGIIGATGSGKSTIIRLLLRFYDADSGNIYIKGRDIKTYKPSELYEIFGTALQNDFIYSETVRENIVFGRDISENDLIKAAEIAQAKDFILDFNEGFDRILSSGGVNISGGQRQRLLIARALAGSPEILILDDSSSALDYKTDAALRTALKEDMKGTALITVAQRVSSVKDCDTVLVIEKGEIIGKGSHSELINTCPQYKEISDSQMGGAILE